MGLFDIFKKNPAEPPAPSVQPVPAARQATRDETKGRNTPYGYAHPYRVVDSDGFRRSFAQLRPGTELELVLHPDTGEDARPGRVRASRNGKTIGYLSGSGSAKYLSVVQAAHAVGAQLTLDGIVDEYRYETAVAVFLPKPEALLEALEKAARNAGIAWPPPIDLPRETAPAPSASRKAGPPPPEPTNPAHWAALIPETVKPQGGPLGQELPYRVVSNGYRANFKGIRPGEDLALRVRMQTSEQQTPHIEVVRDGLCLGVMEPVRGQHFAPAIRLADQHGIGMTLGGTAAEFNGRLEAFVFLPDAQELHDALASGIQAASRQP